MKKRILSAVLALLTAVSIMPRVPLRAADVDNIPHYHPDPMSGVPIINAELASYKQFLDSKEAKMKMFNAANELGMNYKMKETLDYYVNKTFHADNFGDATFWNLYMDGQISVRFGAYLRGDKHGSVKNHPFKYKYSYQSMSLSGKTIKGPNNDNRKYLYSSSEDSYFRKMGGDRFKLKITSGGCSDCGSPKFSNPLVLFADMVAPRLESYYMTDTDTNNSIPPKRQDADTYTSTGEMYIHLVFSEAIRFADLSAKHNDVRLGLNFANRYTNTWTQETVYASLYALRGNTLTFKYTVPETLGKTTPNHKLIGFTGITLASGQDALYAKDAYPLKIDMQSSDPDTVVNVMAKASKAAGNTSIKKDNLVKGGYTTVDSLITDLAGNALSADSTSTLKKLIGNTNNPVADFTAPYIEKVDISLYRQIQNTYNGWNGPYTTTYWQNLTGAVVNGDTVGIHGRGTDRVEFVVTVSELAEDNAAPVLTTNVLDKDGKQIRLSPVRSRIKSGTPRKTEFLYELNLTSDMSLPKDENFRAATIEIFSDAYQNQLDVRPSSGIAEAGQLLPSVNRTLYFDRLSPIITTTFAPDASTGYVNVAEVPGEDALGYVDFTITDTTADGEKHASGTIQIGDQPVDGTVRFMTATDPTEHVTLDYAIVPTGTALNEIAFNSATPGSANTFTQGIGTQELYIRLPENFPTALLPLRVEIVCDDFVENHASLSMTLAPEYFRHRLDRTPPTIAYHGQVTAYDPASGIGSITDSFTVSDAGHIVPTSIQYALVAVDQAPTDADWKLAPIQATENAERFRFDLTQTLGSEIFERHLYVRAADASANANQSVAGPYSLSYDYTLPTLTFVTNAATHTQSPKLEVSAPAAATDGISAPAGIALIRPRNPADYMGNTLFQTENNYILAYSKIDGTPKDFMDPANWIAYGRWDPDRMTFTEIADDDYERVFRTYYSQNRFNGTLDVQAFFAYGLAYDKDTGKIASTDNRPISETYPFTFTMVSPWVEAAPQLYDIRVSWLDPDALEANPAWTPDSEGFPALTDLAGAAFDVHITNLRAQELGMLLLDSDGSYVEVVDDTGAVLYTQKLTGANTRIVLPEGLAYSEGKHKISINAYLRTAFADTVGDTFTTTLDDAQIYVYPDEIGEFGIGGIIGTFSGNDNRLPALLESTREPYRFVSESTDADGNVILTFARPDRIVLNTFETEGGLGYANKLYVQSDKQNNASVNIKVTNISDGVQHTPYWKYAATGEKDTSASNAQYTIVVYDTVEALNAAIHDPNTLPVVANQDNLISYRLVHENGRESTEYTFTLYPDSTMDETHISLTPDASAGLTPTIKATVDALPIGATLYHYRYDFETQEYAWTAVDGTTVALPLLNDVSTADAVEYFCTIDQQGNFAPITLQRPAHLWLHAPEITSDLPTVTNTVVHDLTVSQPTANGQGNLTEEGFRLHVSFDEAYAEKVGVGSLTFDIPPAAEYNTLGRYGYHRVDISDAQRDSGIFYIGVGDNFNSTVAIRDFSMVHKYDAALGADATEDVHVTFVVEDAAGNRSAPLTNTYTFKNIEPALIGIEMRDRAVSSLTGGRSVSTPTLIANVPIAEVYPGAYHPVGDTSSLLLTEQDGWEAWTKSFLNIYRDGVYEVAFVDMFGEYHKSTYTQPVIEWERADNVYDFGMDLQFSDPDPVTGKVTLTYKSIDERLFVDIAQVDGTLPAELWPGQSSDTHTILAKKVNQATVELDPALPLFLMRYDPHEMIYNNRLAYLGSFSGDPTAVVIPEFVNTPPQARIEWYFDEFETDTLPTFYREDGTAYLPTATTQNITAYLVTDRHVDPIDGTALYHTFTWGADDSYTFTYEDLSGQIGSITVSLADIPIVIDEPIPVPEDTEAPDFSLEIYGKYNAVFASEGAYHPAAAETLSEAITAIDWVQGYMLSFQIADVSPTKLVVRAAGTDHTALTYSNAASDRIDGIRAVGSQVYVDAKTDFDVVLIDASNNRTVIPISRDALRLDLTPPYVSDVIKQQTGLYEITAYVLLDDDQVGTDGIEWIFPSESKRVTEGTYSGRYAVVFRSNQTIQVRYADKLGNQGTHDISVDTLNDDEPFVTRITWNPGDNGDTSRPPRQLLNRDVTALVEFSAPIRTLTLHAENGAELYGCDVLLQGDQAILTFSDSAYVYDDALDTYQPAAWDLTLEFVAVNGMQATHALRLEPVIDKTAPHAWIDYPTDDSQNPHVPYVDIVIRDLSEDCYMQDTGSKLYRAGEPITKRITENGIHTFRFYDPAGNVGYARVNVTVIDAAPPVVLLADLPASDHLTNGSVTFRATLNEAGTITIAGQTKTVGAPTDHDGDGIFSEEECRWVTFTVTENGGYRITAEDTAGLITETYISVTAIDRTAPTILFRPTTLTFREGSDRAAVEAALLDGITLHDARSAESDILIQSASFDDTLLHTVGIHPIAITATDKAGNSVTKLRYLRIYDADAPEVLINGVKTYPGEIALIRGTDVHVTCSKLAAAGEPYTVYLRSGVWREGQMKTRAAKLDSLDFTVTKGAYYTLYIVTQSRKTYLTGFYVQ